MTKKFHIFLIFIPGVAFSQTIETRISELANEIGVVDPDAGVSYDQANILASYYREKYLPCCGATYPAVDYKSRWEVTPTSDVSGAPGGFNIIIDKKTGRISKSGGPEIYVKDLLKIRETPPRPVNFRLRNGSLNNLAVVTKFNFLVLYDGSVSAVKFEKSSGTLKCDLKARGVVDKWRFPRRKNPIELVASIESCGD